MSHDSRLTAWENAPQKQSVIYGSVKKKNPPFFGSVETACFYCEIELTDINRSRDHVIPKVLGGTLNKRNKVWACVYCNGEKNNKTLNVWKHHLIKMKFPKKGEARKHVYANRLTIIKNIDLLLKKL